MLVKKLFEILFGDADVNLIIDLQGHTNAITPADAKASGKCNLIFQMMIFHGLLQQLHNLRGTLEMTGATDANLNDHIFHTFALMLFSKNSPTVSGVTE